MKSWNGQTLLILSSIQSPKLSASYQYNAMLSVSHVWVFCPIHDQEIAYRHFMERLCHKHRQEIDLLIQKKQI